MIDIRYRTFDELMAAVEDDFSAYQMEGFVKNSQLIKIAQKINKEFTVKINPDKDRVLELSRGRVKLPNDFYMLNDACLLGQHTVTYPVVHGRHTEDRLVPVKTFNTDPCHTHLVCCDQAYQVVQTFKQETRTFKTFYPIRITASKEVDFNCPNLQVHAEVTAYIKNGWLHTNSDGGTLYINYKGTMEDDDSNLLVLDHDVINEYYEYEIKCRILENMLAAKEPVGEQLTYFNSQRRKARLEALSYNTPDFKELQDIHFANRKRKHQQYYSIFA